MFESLYNSLSNTTATGTAISLKDAILTILISFILGAIISITYMKTSNKGGYSQNFSLTLIIVPTVIAIIVLLIGSNVARAFSLAGAFSIIRFRSAPGDSKDISYVLFAMAAGLACGVGVFGYAVLFTVFLCLLMFFLNLINFGAKKTVKKLLKITIPENLNYEGVFDDIFEKYTKNYELIKVKTTDLGSLFQLVYTVDMNTETSQKEFLDNLRSRNGNLNITLSLYADDEGLGI
ncbi:DUF4956 domain-containing protein [Clostridium thermarum]|uniref:DUF4956 domain-containing protein n=1 Tax=Clostridium thermarum TaxID=1716543 RepID=UPI0013D4EF46|nr:DUF4956 domain-containing protein [Clostridium thermarum]